MLRKIAEYVKEIFWTDPMLTTVNAMTMTGDTSPKSR